jgi:signal transduction histidine kinase
MAIEMQNYEQGKERLEKVKTMSYNSVNKAIQMIEGLLENITVNAGEGMLLNFSEENIIKDVITVHAEASDIYTEEFKLDCNKECIEGVFDGIAIRRLLENLINNALKYGDSNRPITIGVQDGVEDVKLWVHNYGIPIEESKQQKIFSFLAHGEEQKKSKLNSWGMGLTLVKMVVDAHKGNIELISNKEEGTKFLVTLNKYSNETGKVRTRLNFE